MSKRKRDKKQQKALRHHKPEREQSAVPAAAAPIAPPSPPGHQAPAPHLDGLSPAWRQWYERVAQRVGS